jgi:hypothetical protein
MVDRLTMLQLDPTAAIAPNADLVAYTRLGGTYRPEHLTQAIERDRTLFEHRGQVVEVEPIVVNIQPMASLALHLADMAEWTTGWQKSREWLAANEGFRRRVLDQLRAEGPLSSRDIPDTAEVAWQSTGWTHDRNVTQMLEFLTSRARWRPRRGATVWIRRAGVPQDIVAARGRGAAACATSAGCAPSGWRAPRPSVMRVSRWRSRAPPANGGSTRRRPPTDSPDVPPCSRRSIAVHDRSRSTCWLRHAGDVRLREVRWGYCAACAAPRAAGRQARRDGGQEGRCWS